MSPQEFEQALHDAEVKLARLKALYEQWFQGIERLEPSVARKELDRSIDMLKKSIPRNTALRFRTQQLVARYGTYGIYWGRIARQIEEGTYKRDILRVTKKKSFAQRQQQQQDWELDVDVEDVVEDLEDAKTDPGIVAIPGMNGAPSAPSKAPASPLAFDEGDLDAILGALSPSAADESRGRSARPLSPFAMGSARPAPGASATFGKPKERTPVAPPAASVLASAPPVAPPKPPAVAMPKPVAPPAPSPVAAIPKPVAPASPIAKPALVPPSAASAPRPAPSGELDEKQMRAIYSRYVDARRQNNERADVKYESLAESVQKMMPKLREKHGGKAIDFEIVLSNGKVGLKPKVGG